MMPVLIQRGDSPVILAQPHGGTFVPDDISQRLNETGLALADTDWHISQLYDGVLPGASVVRATFHRYVIDANRDPAGNSLYPGQNTTGLCPLTDFDGVSIWRDGAEPTAADVSQRIKNYHAPYHAALAAEVARVKAFHGVAIVYDCHSIRSHIPFLFEGELPALNIGTDNGVTCSKSIADGVQKMAASSPYTNVLNGRFRGGWTTRHYGQPHTGVHAIQMEIAQSVYLEREQAPWNFSPEKAAMLRPWLAYILRVIENTAVELAAHG